MIRKAVVAFAAVVLATVASLALGSVAGAQYSPTCNVTVTPTSAAPGETVTLSGSLDDGATPKPKAPVPNQIVDFFLNSVDGLPLGSATTDADGNFSAEITIPADLAPGTYTIVADCGTGVDGGEILANTDVVVTGATPATPGGNNNQGGGNQGGGNQGVGSGGNQGGGNLARTGTDLGLPVQIGVALLGLGGIALALSASRRRRGATA